VNILFLSAHAFLPTTRKTSAHFVAEAMAARGHETATVSVGYSYLTLLKKPDLFHQLRTLQKNRFVKTGPNSMSACYLPAIHPFSSGNRLVNAITGSLFPLYGNLLPGFLRSAIRKADVVSIESGTALAFFDAVRRVNPKARTLYFSRDRLDSVGASKYLQHMEQRVAPQFDRVVVPSPLLAEHLPATSRVRYIPQGIDKVAFDTCQASPYPPGSRNGISVGNMLFDAEAMAGMARSNPDVTFHVFGSGIANNLPPNAKV
jgi:2-beta-glucuronyltransferase